MTLDPNDFKQDFNSRYPSSRREMSSTRKILDRAKLTKRAANKLLQTTETIKQSLPPIFSNWLPKDRALLVSNIKEIIDSYERLRTKDIETIEDPFPKVLPGLTSILDICKAKWGLRSDLEEYIIDESSKSLENNLRQLEIDLIKGIYPIKSVFFDHSFNFAELTKLQQSQEIYKILYRLIMTSKSILWINQDRSKPEATVEGNNQVFINWMFHKDNSSASLSQLLGLLQQNNDQMKKYVEPRSDIISGEEKAEWALLITRYPAVFQVLSEFTYQIPEKKPIKTLKLDKIRLTQNYIFMILSLYNNIIVGIQDHLVFNKETEMFEVKDESKDKDPKILLQVKRDLKGFKLNLQPSTDGSPIIRNQTIIADQLYNELVTSDINPYVSEAKDRQEVLEYVLALRIRKAITTSITAILKMQAQVLLTKE